MKKLLREISKKRQSACCWCGTNIKCHLVGKNVLLKLSKKSSGNIPEKVLAIEYCPECDDINLLTSLSYTEPLE
jgi:hypothetical protein